MVIDNTGLELECLETFSRSQEDWKKLSVCTVLSHKSPSAKWQIIVTTAFQIHKSKIWSSQKFEMICINIRSHMENWTLLHECHDSNVACKTTFSLCVKGGFKSSMNFMVLLQSQSPDALNVSKHSKIGSYSEICSPSSTRHFTKGHSAYIGWFPVMDQAVTDFLKLMHNNMGNEGLG